MRLIKAFFTLIAVFLIFALQAQIKNSDTEGLTSRASMLQELDTAKQDTDRAMLFSALGDAYVKLNPDTALIMATQGLALSSKTNFARGKAYSFFVLAKAYELTGNYPKALELFFESLKINDSLNSTIWIASNLLFIGEIYSFEEEYEQSLIYLYRAKALADSVHYYNISAWALLYIGSDCEKINHLDSALLCINQSLKLTKQQKVPRITGRIFFALGNIYLKNNALPTAMYYYKKSIPILDSLGDQVTICQSWLGMAKLFEKMRQADSAMYYGKLSLTTAQKQRFLFQVYNAADFLTAYYKNQKNIDSAFFYQEISFSAKDSLFSQEKTIAFQNVAFTKKLEQQKILELQDKYRNRIRTYILIAGLAILILIAVILLRNIRQKQKANQLLSQQKKEIDFQKDEIEKSFLELKSTQAQLIQSEKMASLGELTAGIAHEIQNPLNFVNNFSEVNKEMLVELNEEIDKGNYNEAKAIAKDIINNEEKINHYGKRADAIVKGMLQHSRSSSGVKEPTDINALCGEYLRLSYHGFRTKDKNFNAIIKTDYDSSVEKIRIIPQDIARVILNLYNNAFYAVLEKSKQNSENYEPAISLTTQNMVDKVSISVKDNGNGIPQNIIDKVFQPFFTTKPSGQGTGLGLSLSYDIIKAHGGEIKVETMEGEGATFIIELPVK